MTMPMPRYGVTAPEPRPLHTEEEILAAIGDMEKLMDATAVLYEHHHREVAARMPLAFCINDAIRVDLDALQTTWLHTQFIRNSLIVHLFETKRAKVREE